MSIDFGSVAISLMSFTVSTLLLLFAYRGFRTSRNWGFLVLAVALVLVPWLMDVVDRPLVTWIHQQGRSLRFFGMIQLAQLAVQNSLLGAALILLARPLHRSRRA